jgi:hypothetical protein
MLDKIKGLIDGKKTYIVAGVATLIAGLQLFGVIGAVPETVWIVLSALGLGSVRDAIGRVKK